MLFIELRFFVFLAVVLGIYWSLRSHPGRKIWLLGASYFFYAAWDWRFLSLILISTGIDYLVGLRLDDPERAGSRRWWIFLSVAGNLSILGFFKYFNFFAESLVELGQVAGISISRPTLDVVLPVGISFYTFQTMSYSLDIYRGKLKATRSLLDLALFVAFFPQLVAGPIVRAREFLPQLASLRLFSRVEVRSCLTLFLVGFVKKACVADNVSPYVDQYFAGPHMYDVLSAWIAVLLYAIQIYCDFSGYSDMAIATAGLLGYRLPVNFAAPYFAGSITDFWRRWHISLSSWLKDYLYIPLGGGRGGKAMQYRNLMATMLLGGLWHGAAWRFVAWGGMHGLALIVNKEWSALIGENRTARRFMGFLGPVLTFYWVCVAWIFFRAESFTNALDVLKPFVFLSAEGTMSLPLELLPVIPVLALLHRLSSVKFLGEWVHRSPMPVFSTAYGALFALAVTMVPMGYKPFIYFQF